MLTFASNWSETGRVQCNQPSGGNARTLQDVRFIEAAKRYRRDLAALLEELKELLGNTFFAGALLKSFLSLN
jgi:hypothetical protein